MLNTSMSPDQMAAAGSYISREWGDYGSPRAYARA